MARVIRSFTAKALLVTMCVTLVAAWPAYAWGAEPGLRALLLAAAVAFAGAALGRLAGAVVPRTTPEADVQVVMVSLGTRLLATAAMALAVIVLRPVPRVPFAAWLGLLYAALLLLEVNQALASARGTERLLENGGGAASS